MYIYIHIKSTKCSLELVAFLQCFKGNWKTISVFRFCFIPIERARIFLSIIIINFMTN